MKRCIGLALGVVALLALVLMSTPALAALCFNCGSGSSNGCKQCRSASGKDTSADRKACTNKGCKISGTSSCSTAANVKVCSVLRRGPQPAQQSSAFFIY